MSYCRFTEGSDVYAYECDGGVQFWVAGKANRGLDHLCNTYNEAYQYAKYLRDEHGLDVPDYAIEALRFDALDEAKRFNGPKGVVAELKAENAKLREEIELVGTAGYLLAMKQLKDENGKLRDDLETQREVATHNTNRNAREYKRVRDENDKLRELAKKLKACNSSCGRCIELYGICEHEIELAELGIEVDG